MLTYILEVTLCWSIFYGIFYTALRKVTFYRVNRIYLILSIIGGIMIPLLKYCEINVAPQSSSVEWAPLLYYVKETPSFISTTIVDQTKHIGESWSVQSILLVLYNLGVIALIIRLFRGLYSIYLLYSEGAKIIKSKYTLVKTKKAHLPFSFYKYVFVSSTIELDESYNQILKHELAHVKSWHSLDVLFLEVINIVFWFHPLIYLFKTALRQTHEYLADEAVLKDTNKRVYGQLLLKQSISGLQIALTHHFFHSFTKNRINMMYQNKSSKATWFKYALVLPVLCILLTAFAQTTSEEGVKVVVVQGDDPPKTMYQLKGTGITTDFDNLKDIAYQDIARVEFFDNKGVKVDAPKPDLYVQKNETYLNRNSLNIDENPLSPEFQDIIESIKSEGTQYATMRFKLLYALYAHNDEERIDEINSFFDRQASVHRIQFDYFDGQIIDVQYPNSNFSRFPSRYAKYPFSKQIIFSEIDNFIKSIGGKLTTDIDRVMLDIHYNILLEHYPGHTWDILEVFNTYMRDNFNILEAFYPPLIPEKNRMAPPELLQYLDETDTEKAPLVWVEGVVNDFPLRFNVDLNKPIGKYTYISPENAIKVFGEKAKFGFYALFDIQRPYNHPEAIKKRIDREITNFFSTIKSQPQAMWSFSLKKFHQGLLKRNTDQSRKMNHQYAGILTQVSNKAIEHGITLVFKEDKIIKMYITDEQGEYVRID